MQGIIINIQIPKIRSQQKFYKKTKNKYLMHKTGKIIFVGGVHGVGKSTFASMIKSKYSQIESLSCSDIIKWENPTHKKVENVGETQADDNGQGRNRKKVAQGFYSHTAK